MSQVFDALQRFESERPGVAVRVFSTALDLLEAAERNARPKADLEVHKTVRCSSDPKEDSLATGVRDNGTADKRDVRGTTKDLSLFRSASVATQSEARLVCVTDPESLAAEKFRYLGVRLQEIRSCRQLKTVLITSTVPQEGKSMLSANLACTLAGTTSEKVLLVDSDLRRSSIARLFGTAELPGLSQCLEGKNDLKECIVRLEGPNVWLLSAGAGSSSPLQLLQSGRLPQIMVQLAGWFDWIIIDSCPAIPMADTSIWMRQADGILLVARPGTTEARQLRSFLGAVDLKKLVGAVLNCANRPIRDAYYYKAPSAAD